MLLYSMDIALGSTLSTAKAGGALLFIGMMIAAFGLTLRYMLVGDSEQEPGTQPNLNQSTTVAYHTPGKDASEATTLIY
jgi:hypothetical protein